MRIESVSSSIRTSAMEKAFRDSYCERHGITHAEFVPHVLNSSLYPPARRIRWLLGPDFFGPDREFIHALGFAKSRKAFAHAQEEFHQFYTHGLLRRVCKLRVSSNRVRDLFYLEVGE